MLLYINEKNIKPNVENNIFDFQPYISKYKDEPLNNLDFKNARKVVEVAEKVPLDRILIETDTPYLAPHPFRGQINHSGLVRYTAEKLAEIKGMSADEIADITFDNASNLFGIK